LRGGAGHWPCAAFLLDALAGTGRRLIPSQDEAVYRSPIEIN
jgi:hypothetical protein